MKKVIVLVAVLALLLTLFAGCGESTEPSPTAVSAPAESTSAPEAPTSAPSEPTTAPEPTAAPAATPTAAASQGSDDLLAKLQGIASFSCDIKMSAGDEVVSTGHMAVKNEQMRVDMVAEGMEISMIFDPEENATYMYNAADNTAIKFSIDEAMDTTDIENPIDLVDEESEYNKVGTETIDGRPCDVYEVISPDETSKIWLDQEIGFPLRTETETSEGLIVTEFSNVQIGNVDDSYFELPADVEIQDFGSMLGGVMSGEGEFDIDIDFEGSVDLGQ